MGGKQWFSGGGKMRGRPARPPALSVCSLGEGWEESLCIKYFLSDHRVAPQRAGRREQDEPDTVLAGLRPSVAEQGPAGGVGAESPWAGALLSLPNLGRRRWHLRAAHPPQLRALSWRVRGRSVEHGGRSRASLVGPSAK